MTISETCMTLRCLKNDFPSGLGVARDRQRAVDATTVRGHDNLCNASGALLLEK